MYQRKKQTLSIQLLFVIFTSFIVTGSVSLIVPEENIIPTSEIPEALEYNVFETHPTTIDIQTSGYTTSSTILKSEQDSFYYNYPIDDTPIVPLTSGEFVNTFSGDTNIGSASNLLTESGNFSIEPALLSMDYSPDLEGPKIEDISSTNRIVFDTDVDDAIKTSVENSYYTNSWIGQVGDEDTVYSIIFPVNSGMQVTDIGIGFCDKYARYVPWGWTETSCYNDDWIKGASWTHQSYTIPTTKVFNNYYGDKGSSFIMMPTENVLADRIYIYRILYSDDYYHWYNVNDSLLSTQDYSDYWDGNTELFYDNLGRPNRDSFEYSESTKSANIRTPTTDYYEDPFNTQNIVDFETVDNYYASVGNAKQILPSGISDYTTELTWNGFETSIDHAINPKYIQVRIEKIIYTHGSMYGLGRTENGKFQGSPEIGEIKIRYKIKMDEDYNTFTDASINYPMNHSIIQANSFDTLPLDFSYYSKSENMLNDGSLESIDELYFYLNGDSTTKYNLLNTNPNPTATIYNPITSTHYSTNIYENSWIDTSYLDGSTTGWYAQNPLNSLTNYIDIDVSTSTTYGSLYDTIVELEDIGSTDLVTKYERRFWNTTDISGTTFASAPQPIYNYYESANAYSIDVNPTNTSDNSLYLNDGLTANYYSFNIASNYSTNWDVGTNIQFKLRNSGTNSRTIFYIDSNGEVIETIEDYPIENDDYIALIYNASIYFNIKDGTTDPSNEYLKRTVQCAIPISGNWNENTPITYLNTIHNSPYIVENPSQYSQLTTDGSWKLYSFNELGSITETILREMENPFYLHEIDSGCLYSYEFTNVSLICIENTDISGDLICIDDVIVRSFPFVENIMTQFELLYGDDTTYNTGYLLTPQTEDQYLINNEETIINPINQIMAYYFAGDVEKYFETIEPYLGKTINYTFDPLLMSHSDTLYLRMRFLNTYQYGYTQYTSTFYNPLPTLDLFQYGHFNIKNIYVQATDITKDWVSYNKVSNLLSTNQVYMDEENQLKCAILRNIFASASKSDDVDISYMKTSEGDFTNIYSGNPTNNTYFQVSFNAPVSSFYDICLRDSYMGDLYDNNSYAIYLDGTLYRIFSQTSNSFEQIETSSINGLLYTSQSASYNTLSQLPLQAYLNRPDYQNGEIIRSISEYLTAGIHTIRIQLYTQNATYMKFRYDQLLLFYQSIRSFNFPIAQLDALSESTTQSITVHIKNGLDDSIKETTTYYSLFVNPYANFNTGILPNNLIPYITTSTNTLTQEMSINHNMKNNIYLNCIFYDTNINASTFKYFIDKYEYSFNSSDIIYNHLNSFYQIEKNISTNLATIGLGKHIIKIQCYDLKNLKQESFLVFYYDTHSPELEYTPDLESNLIEVSNFEYNVTGNPTLDFITSDNVQLKSIEYTLNKTMSMGLKSQIQKYSIYNIEINVTKYSSLAFTINLLQNQLDFGDNSLILYITDMANNTYSQTYKLHRQGFYTYLNTTAIDWLNYNSSIPISIQSVQIQSYNGGSGSAVKSYTEAIKYASEQSSIKMGISDLDSFEIIDQHFVLDHCVINNVTLFITTSSEITRFPLKLQILSVTENLISEALIYATVKKNTLQGITVQIPSVIINEPTEYILRIQTEIAKYNLYSIYTVTEYKNSKNFRLSGWNNDQETQLTGMLAFSLGATNGIIINDAETYGNIRYSINGYTSPIFSNGICDTNISISNIKHGLNTIYITSEIATNEIISSSMSFLWFDPNVHTVSNIDFITPTSSVYSENITIKFYYSYPEYDEVYDCQLFLINKQSDEQYWLTNFTIMWNETQYNQNYISYTFNSSMTFEEIAWLEDSSHYYIQLVINETFIEDDDQYSTIRTVESTRFTIDNEGMRIEILSPIENDAFKNQVTLEVNLQTYTRTISKIYYYVDLDENNYNYLSYNYVNLFALDGSRLYLFNYVIDINQYVDGEHIITIVFEDNLGKKHLDSVTIIKDTYTYANILSYTPLRPYDKSNIVITYENSESYKILQIYILYKYTYNNDVGFILYDEVTSNINGSYNMGQLKYGSYEITFRFIDQAGNMAQDSVSINVTELGSFVAIGEAFREWIMTLLGVFGITGIIIYKKTHSNLENTNYSSLNKIINQY